jgi:uncharacterized protein YaeQ
MAKGATIYKVNVSLSNFNTHYYQDFNLTLAKHPSENETRMMFRLLAYLYCANEKLEFTKGLSEQDEPEIWLKDFSGDILHWIELGQVEEKRIKQATSRSQKVTIFTYHQNKALEWFEKIQGKVCTNDKLEIFHLNIFENGPIEKITEKTMRLSCTIDDNHMYLGNDIERIGIEVVKAK